MSEVIMLSKKLDLKQLKFPCYVSEKLDGVAADFYGDMVRSRPGKDIKSVQHIQDHLGKFLAPDQHLIGELYVPGMAFKDISGLVRTFSTQPKLQLHVFDYYSEGYESTPFAQRLETAQLILAAWPSDLVKVIPQFKFFDEKSLTDWIGDFLRREPQAEGVVIRHADGPTSVYKKGWRSTGYFKYKPRKLINLTVESFEEAISQEGIPLGMIGRINCWYNEKLIGVSPGKLSHDERKIVFQNQAEYMSTVCEVKYMRDNTYESLRQPTFQRWRTNENT